MSSNNLNESLRFDAAFEMFNSNASDTLIEDTPRTTIKKKFDFKVQDNSKLKNFLHDIPNEI